MKIFYANRLIFKLHPYGWSAKIRKSSLKKISNYTITYFWPST